MQYTLHPDDVTRQVPEPCYTLNRRVRPREPRKRCAHRSSPLLWGLLVDATVNEPLSKKDKYYAECLIRHPELRKDLLAFHQQFPPLFKRTHQWGKTLSGWLQKLMRKQGPDCIILVPETFADIARLYSPLLVNELRVAGYGRRLLPQDGQRDYALMQISPAQWREAWETLRCTWPKVPEPFLWYGTLSEAYRPSLLVPNEPFSAQEWSEQLTCAAAGSKLIIPIYPETTLDDIERLWKDVQHLKDWVYRPSSEDHPQPDPNMGDEPANTRGKKRRERPTQYTKRLQVWDAVQECGTFAQAARRLRMKESTLKGVYIMAARDILGKPDPRNPRERVLADFDPTKHRDCPTCKAARCLEEMCPQARAYASQDEVPLFGKPSDTLDKLPANPS